MKELKPASEYTKEEIDKVKLGILTHAANQLGVGVTDLVIRDGVSEWSTEDGVTLICKRLR